MAILFWVLAAVVGATLMMVASQVAIRHAVALSEKLSLPPLLVGITIVALGTDMPELVNSVISSYLGHGDINVGDSVGSVFTQGSLILGLIPFVVSGVVVAKRREMFLLAGLAITSLLISAWLMRDGMLSRFDAAILAVMGLAATTITWRLHVDDSGAAKPVASSQGVLRHASMALLALAVVGGGAAGLVFGVVGVSESLGVPEYIVSFFGAALGTSLPELVVNLTAMRRGHRDLALGGVFGACLLDASISMAAGPLLFPTTVTAGLALRGVIMASVTMLVAGLTLGLRRKHDRSSGALLIAVYIAGYVSLIGFR